MPSPVVHRSLTTIHAALQNNTDQSNSTSTATLTSTSSSHSHKGMISGLLVAFNILLILFLYFCFYRYFFRKQPSSSSHHHHSTATTGTPDSSPPTSPRTGRALELHVLNSIPIVEFNSNNAQIAAECAVCLAEINDGDKVRVLLQCSHRFHVDCVDMWFRSHADCPFCRTPVEEIMAANRSESIV